jgi:hypothetical protein
MSKEVWEKTEEIWRNTCSRVVWVYNKSLVISPEIQHGPLWGEASILF